MAKPEQSSKPFLIYKARNEKIVSQENGESTVRIARFLKPCAQHVDQTVGIPNTPLLSEIFPHSLQQWPSKVLFRGWGCPQRRWKEWVDSLAQKYGCIWNQTGICDAIMSSLYEVRCNQSLLLGLSEFWCSDTNSFVFPWGEATITLEDVMILGGFPVTGEEIKSPLPEEFVEIEEEMNKRRNVILRSRAKKVLHGTWMKNCMEEKGEFEHVAFLSLWLSRFVFPSLPGKTIAKNVFPIAVRLSRGRRMAIAPAVLASLYRDLRLLKEQAMDSKESIVLSGPFQLIQLWAFEHFALTGPNSPNLLQPGEPRAARWHKLRSFKINLPLIRSALRLVENFQPRPYAANLENWRHPPHYRETEQFLYMGSSLDVELRSFLQCLQGCELVGVDCKERYLPHRVAMQFGLDQDLPGDPSGFTFASEVVGFFVPPRSFRPGVSERFMKWWKDRMLCRQGGIKDVLVQNGYGEIFKDSSPCNGNGNGEDFHASVSSSQASSGKSSGERSHSSRTLEFPSKDRKRRFCYCSSDEDDDDCVLSHRVARANVSSQATLKSKISSSVQAEKSEGGGCNLSIESKNPKKLPQVSTESDSKKKNHESVTPKSPSEIKDNVSYDLSDDDNLPISFRLKRRALKGTCTSPEASYYKFQNASSSSKHVNENGRKRKLHTTEKETLLDKATKKPASGVSKGLGGKAAGKFTHELNGIAREVKTEGARSFNEPIDIDEINWEMLLAKNSAEAEKPIKAGESLYDQKNVSTSSKLANENGRKRKLHTTVEEEILVNKVTMKPANRVSKGLEAKAAGKCTFELNDVAREVKTEEGCYVNGEINWEMRKSKESRGSTAAKGSAEVKKSTNASGSIHDPIELIWEMQKSKESRGPATAKGSAEVENSTKAGGSIYDLVNWEMRKSKESGGSTTAKGSAEVKKSTKASGSIHDPIDLIWEMQKSKESRGPATAQGSAEVENSTKAGGSIYDLIDLDDYADIVTTVGFETLGRELEKRVEKLEKLLGAI